MMHLQLFNAILWGSEKRLQVEGVAGILWKLAYNLYTPEQIEHKESLTGCLPLCK